VVGIIKGGDSKRAIGLRADMDALPMSEHNAFAHASVHAGKMHACGHDGHIVMLLAAAKYLSKHRQFDGTVYLIFQPAEETGACLSASQWTQSSECTIGPAWPWGSLRLGPEQYSRPAMSSKSLSAAVGLTQPCRTMALIRCR
jgi:hypothetical protein